MVNTVGSERRPLCSGWRGARELQPAARSPDPGVLSLAQMGLESRGGATATAIAIGSAAEGVAMCSREGEKHTHISVSRVAMAVALAAR